MQNRRQTKVQIRTGKKTGIWLALAVALALHAVILLLPITRQLPPAENERVHIELQLTSFTPQPPAPETPEQQLETITPVPVPEPFPAPPETIVKAQTEIKPAILAANPQARDLEHDLEKMSEQTKRRMTNSILTRQFISEQSEADKLFGRPLVAYSSEP